MPVPMIRELSRLRDEATRLLEIYTEHANSQDEALRRRRPADLQTLTLLNMNMNLNELQGG